MPTSKVCGKCASCGKEFAQGDEAIFFGHVRVVKDKLEPGGVRCPHTPESAINVSHSHSEERCVLCQTCWGNVKADYIKRDITQNGCTPHRKIS